MPQSLVGRLLDGRYRIEARIGAGGMGDVYRAVHEMLGSRVAIKVLVGQRTSDPSAARRFVREAKSAFRIDHPNCVRVTDLGADVDLLFIVMEYLDGRTVGAELAVDGPMASARVAHIGAQTARAVAHAHTLGLVHRDLKPDNLMLVRRGSDPDFTKVLDFGLARVFDEHGDLTDTAYSLSPLTRDGMVFGTPSYMSPEQASGATVGPPSDIYSLGAVLYHMSTGREPFVGPHFMDVLSKHVREAPVPPRQLRADIEPALEQIIVECLAKDPAHRPASGDEVARRLVELDLALPAQSDRPQRQASGGAGPVAQVETVELPSAITADIVPPTPVSTDELRASVRNRRPLGLVIAGAAFAAVIVTLAWAMTRDRAPARAGGPAHDAASDQPAVSAQVPAAELDADPAAPAEPLAGPSIDAAPAIDAASAPARDHQPRKSKRQLATETHIAAAEKARAQGNLLRQIAEADAALRLDRSNRRARQLLGEALVKSGDRARGCALLERTAMYNRVGCAN